MPHSAHAPNVPRPAYRAVLWDLDGTLYHQRPLRRRMLFELARAPLREGLGARHTLRRLKAFRRVREELRELGRPAESLEELQYAEPARRIGDQADAVRRTVTEWMYQRPLPYLAACLRDGLVELLAELKSQGLRLGVFSDYPAPDKLEALGLSEQFSLTLCATDPEINAFKPHPAGFERACELWDLAPAEVLYVGDRDDVDGVGATAAGMPVCIIDDRPGTLGGVRRATGG
jgi:putative hydrolase of the HAD superfamily